MGSAKYCLNKEDIFCAFVIQQFETAIGLQPEHDCLASTNGGWGGLGWGGWSEQILNTIV